MATFVSRRRSTGGNRQNLESYPCVPVKAISTSPLHRKRGSQVAQIGMFDISKKNGPGQTVVLVALGTIFLEFFSLAVKSAFEKRYVYRTSGDKDGRAVQAPERHSTWGP